MLIRIVKLTFKPENIHSFEKLFEETKEVIRGFKGCSFLELYQDNNSPEVFFTYSYWESEEYLEAYRNSDFFKNVWGQTRQLFAEKPQAWSVTKIATLN